MSAKHRCNRHGAGKGAYPVNSPRAANVGISRAALLASASLIALGALGLPGTAWAGCDGTKTTVATTVSGPILSTGGSIRVLKSGTVNGGPTGVSASSCSISTLTNRGSILGGPSGGVGELNSQAITSGGNGGSGYLGLRGAGGAGVENSGTIVTLINRGTIEGGSAGSGGFGITSRPLSRASTAAVLLTRTPTAR